MYRWYINMINRLFVKYVGEIFSCQDYLTTHKYQHHRDNNCNSKRSEVSADVDEIPSSTQICNYCGKSFGTKAVLNVHINLVHEKTVGKFDCQFCESKFVAKICLKKHLWGSHQFSLDGYQPSKQTNKVDELAYQCKVKGCRIGFQKESSLRKHMEERHGEGKDVSYFQFNCKNSGKGFHIRSRLENHQSVHENKESKPIVCELCGKRFPILRYLKIHKVNVHKIGSEKSIKNE